MAVAQSSSWETFSSSVMRNRIRVESKLAAASHAGSSWILLDSGLRS
jgi:hypothetical protein